MSRRKAWFFEESVKHFSEADWANFVRNQATANTRMAMQRHIDDGCKKCQATLQIWQSVLAITANESALTPPSEVVRVVKSQFAAVMPQPSRGVRLIFDSLLQPLTAGIRGSVAARQFLYETDDYYIDLRLEPRSLEDRAWLVGQVLNRTGKQAAQAVPVRVQQGQQPIAKTATNQFGEFQLEFKAANEMCISIGGDRENQIILPLYEMQTKPVKRKALDGGGFRG
jgi:hypothetical protein